LKGKICVFSIKNGIKAPTHMLFVDDLIVYPNARKGNLKNLMVFFSKYQSASG
jgi:hypothetical protein